MITRAADCPIRLFMACLFDNWLEVLGDGTEAERLAAWETIYTEYRDLSGASQNTEWGLLKSINQLSTRVKAVQGHIQLQRAFIKEFSLPFLPALKDFKAYGHIIAWTGDLNRFKGALNLIEAKEKKNEALLDFKAKQLNELRAKNTTEATTNERTEFLRLLNHLEKYGFKIKEEVTSVERLALMIRDYYEAMKRLNEQNNKK